MKRTTLFGTLILCMAIGAAHATTYRVPMDFAVIQDAIDASENGDTVLVMPGVYFQRIDFAGKNITVTGTDPDNPAVVGYTILNGQNEGSVVTFANGEGAGAVLTGLTLTGGIGTYFPELSQGSERIYFGGGIFLDRTSPTITKNVIVRNMGIMEISENQQSIDFCFGGAIGGYDCSPTISHNVIRNNSAYAGAGFTAYFGSPTVHNNVFFDNSGFAGGGLLTFAGDIYNNTFYRNDCDSFTDIVGQSGQGGHIYLLAEPSVGLARVFNNILVGATSGSGIYMEGYLDAVFFGYNDVWDNYPDNYSSYDGETGQQHLGGEADRTGVNGNISQNPFFESTMNRNYHLTLDSLCINAGDPDFIPPAGQRDMDGQERVYGGRIDIGAYEYRGYVKPTAVAGHDVHVVETMQTVTLDGSDSFFYDPNGPRTYHWTQISGPEVTLDDPDSATPSFAPPVEGDYVFELVVGDDQYTSGPDEVLVFVGANRAPVAEAGGDRVWPAPGQVTLDGSGSYDPDQIDRLQYIWSQVEGPEVVLADADTATPTFESEPGLKYVFELVVTDGFEESAPSQVQIVTVGLTADLMQLAVDPLESLYPHYVDISGSKVVFTSDPITSYNWRISYRDFRTGATETFSAGGINLHPKIEGDLVVWAGGATLGNTVVPETLSIVARDISTGEQVTLRARSDSESFSHPAISGDTVVWVQHQGLDKNNTDQWANMPYDICGADVRDLENPVHFTIATGVGRRDPMALGALHTDYRDVVDISGDRVVWEGDGDIYVADISDTSAIKVYRVCDHPAGQYDPAISGSYVVWTDQRNDDGDIYGADISDLENIEVFEIVRRAGVQRQPAVDGSLVAYVGGQAAGGEVQIACITRNYGTLIPEFGGGLYGMGPALDGTFLAGLNSEYGPVMAARITLGYSIFDGPIENVTTGQTYDYIQHAISDAEDGQVVVVPEGVHHEKINFVGRAITVRSANPSDPAVVAATVLTGNGHIVTFAESERDSSVLDGVTLTGGATGLFAADANPTVIRCVLADNRGAGVVLADESDPTFTHCRIVGNRRHGIDMRVTGTSRVRHCQPKLFNCIVAGNGGIGLRSGKPTLTNCTVVQNAGVGLDTGGGTMVNSIVYANGDGEVQIDDNRIGVTYCDVQGGRSGTGNLDVDPEFVSLGQWLNGLWIEGDYHLKSEGFRWDASAGQWTTDTVTSLCIDAGDPAWALGDEPTTLPDGTSAANERINLGAYGGTVEASLAP